MGYTFEIHEYANSDFGFCLPPRLNANLSFSGQVPVQQVPVQQAPVQQALLQQRPLLRQVPLQQQPLQKPQQRRALRLLQQVLLRLQLLLQQQLTLQQQLLQKRQPPRQRQQLQLRRQRRRRQQPQLLQQQQRLLLLRQRQRQQQQRPRRRRRQQHQQLQQLRRLLRQQLLSLRQMHQMMHGLLPWRAGGRRRRANTEKKNKASKYFSMNDKTRLCSSRPESISTIKPSTISSENQLSFKNKLLGQNPASEPFNSKNGVSVSTVPTSASTLNTNPYFRSISDISKDTSIQRESETNSARLTSVARISRIDKPLTNEGNKNIKPPNRNEEIHLAEVNTEKLPSVTVTKLPREMSTKSRGNIIKVEKSNISPRENTQLSDKSFSRIHSTSSVRISKVNRSSLPNMDNASHSINNVVSPVNERITKETSFITLPQSNSPSTILNMHQSTASEAFKSIDIQRNSSHSSNQKQNDKARLSGSSTKVTK
ncbi:unnamed protein product, partial [Rotaria magnacalcarata]